MLRHYGGDAPCCAILACHPRPQGARAELICSGMAGLRDDDETADGGQVPIIQPISRERAIDAIWLGRYLCMLYRYARIA